jgi:hypothetical protein
MYIIGKVFTMQHISYGKAESTTENQYKIYNPKSQSKSSYTDQQAFQQNNTFFFNC